MIKYIRIQNGYVEDTTSSIFEWYHDVGFPTRYEALADLSKHIFLDFYKRYVTNRNKACCAKAKGAGTAFCPDCGRRVSKPAWPEQYRSHLQRFHYSTITELDLPYGLMEGQGWNFYGKPFGIREEEALCIGQYGVEALLLASTEAMPTPEIKEEWRAFLFDGGGGLPYWAWEEDTIESIVASITDRVNDEAF
jgi:hypothetical protein